jgi:SAM-dependent methyltransferase
LETSPPFIDWGDLRRIRPFSEGYGFDRGTPVDRVYIEAFLAEHRQRIHGDVLEVHDSVYTEMFGTGVRKHVVDIDPANPRATIIADLSEPGSLPAEHFDCFILTQTLQYVSDVGLALRNARRALRPGGTLLCSVPTTSRVDSRASKTDRWRFTPAGLACLIVESCRDAEIEVQGFGNLPTQVAFLMGLAAEELEPEELTVYDPDFPLLACARVTK